MHQCMKQPGLMLVHSWAKPGPGVSGCRTQGPRAGVGLLSSGTASSHSWLRGQDVLNLVLVHW